VAVLLAILLALGVPFAQLQTSTDPVTCCCPDPDTCKCPDHQPDDGQSSMRACHKGSPELVHATLAAFVAPERIALVIPAPHAVVIVHVVPAPHAPPAPRRPDAPS
jgi:hypothetical protein